MSDAEFPEPRLTNHQDAEVVEYQAVSGLAVAGLVVGLGGAVAFIHPSLCIVPLAGVLLGVLALRRIARDAPALIGRKAAVAGLVLSLFCAAAAPSQWSAYRGFMRAEARQAAEAWFNFLRGDEPHKAHQLTRHPRYRLPMDDSLWATYEEGSEAREELENYVSRPEVRALLALGDKARVRYYDTEGQGRVEGRDTVYQVYAVSYNESGKEKTFFIGLSLERYRLPSTGRAYWRVVRSEGGIRPDALGATEEETPLARISHHRVPLLRRSSVFAGVNALHCFCEAVAHCSAPSPAGDTIRANRRKPLW